jgi:HAD superfamily hydrolase (TIGR01484 family)
LRPASDLSPEEARSLSGLIFDLDDTLLDHGALTEAAYTALFRMREAGLRLIACTGRPAGWAEVIARQWPIDAAIAENGAVAFVRAPTGEVDRALIPRTRAAREERRQRRIELLSLADELIARFPDAALADDNDLRLTDVTIDVGEHRRVKPEDATAMREIARERGVRTLQSSVHLHLSVETADKASGSVRLLWEIFGEDPTRARQRYAFAGDSGNDAACFAAFASTFGVANVRSHLNKLSVPPRFVASAPMGRGFAEIAAQITSHRRSPPPG